MVDNRLGHATLENAEIRFRNFSGKADQYNREGARNFAVFLDSNVAEVMAKDGWNIKQLKPREEGDEGQHYMQVKVNFAGRPPQITLITSSGRNNLDEGTVSSLDYAAIANADLIISPYHWEMNGNTGVTAYLHKLFITIDEDDLDRKYAIPEGGNPNDEEYAPY